MKISLVKVKQKIYNYSCICLALEEKIHNFKIIF